VSTIAAACNSIVLNGGSRGIGDLDLLAAARRGDTGAFVELSSRQSRRILCKLFRITNNWQDAEDLLQDALMKAWVHLDAFECRSSFSTWLTRIAINNALMLLRKNRGVVHVAIDDSPDDGPRLEKLELKDPRESPEQRFERRQKTEMVQTAILRLRPESRKVIELHQNGELSIKEIAATLGLSESAVKSRLMRARSFLRGAVQRKSAHCHGAARQRPHLDSKQISLGR
jgi:RNA polymerase sigma-70 factor, ECF subfamily